MASRWNSNRDKETRDELFKHYDAMLTTDLIMAEAQVLMIITDQGRYLTGARLEQLNESLEVIRQIINARLYP